jgi:hypothetical protein
MDHSWIIQLGVGSQNWTVLYIAIDSGLTTDLPMRSVNC